MGSVSFDVFPDSRMLTNPSSSPAAGDLHRLWYTDDYFDRIVARIGGSD